MNAILKSGLGPPPRILRRPSGPCPHRTGAPHHLPVHCPGRAGRRLDRGGGGCRVAPPDRGKPPGAGARAAFRRPDSPDPAIWLVRQLVNGSGISRGAEPGARSRSDVGTRRADRRDARGRGRRAKRAAAAGSEGYEPEWRHSDGGELLLEAGGTTTRRRFSVNASQRRTMKNATEPSQNTLPAAHRCRPPGRVNAIGPGVWRHCGAGRIRPLSGPAWKSAGPTINPTRNDYARRTLESAASASLRREMPGPEIER